MYEAFFKLKTKPFELVPNPAFIYMSRSHKKAMHYLYYGIREKAGFILLTGEVGSGKTTIISDLIKQVDPNVTLARLFNTKVTYHQLLAMINDDFCLDVKGKDEILLLKELNDFLIDQHIRGYNTVLIIDEAQNLKPELLEEIRMLSNLETDTAKLMQIVLVGQPELRHILAKPEMRQAAQAVAEPSLPDSIVRRLSGRRIALVGVAEVEAERLCAALQRVGAKARLFEGGEPAFGPICDCVAALVHVRPETLPLLWLQPEFSTPAGMLILLIGRRQLLLSLDPAVRLRACDFLMDNWQPDEALMRLSLALARTL